MARGRGRGLAFLDFNDNDNSQLTERPTPPPSSGQFDDECWDDNYTTNGNNNGGDSNNCHSRDLPPTVASGLGGGGEGLKGQHEGQRNGWDSHRSDTSDHGYKNTNNGRNSRNMSNTDDGWEDHDNGVGANGYQNRMDSNFSTKKRDTYGNSSNKSGTGGCFKCGESGHFARECPNPSVETKRSSSSGCFKCGESGHFARECPSPSADSGRGSNTFDQLTLGDGQREAPYIPPPPPEDEDTIFRSIPTGINFAKYDEIPVEVSGRAPPKSLTCFEDAFFEDKIMENIRRAKYEKPTPIQKNAIPIIQANRDLMACAQTGSGKTAAFLLPVITSMLKRGVPMCETNIPQYPEVLIIAPTRELAVQIFMDTRKFVYGTNIRSAVVYGGTSVGSQVKNLCLGVHILVGTPGRLLDFMSKNTVNLSEVKHFILDEADRMLDMGFEPDIRKMVYTFGMPSKVDRQTLMFSATFPDKIQEMAADFLNDYLFLTVGMVGGACSDVEQILLQVDRQEKRQKLCNLLDEFASNKTLVFVEQKRNADFLASYLSQNNYRTTSIHGDRLQREREEALQDFKMGKTPVLIATSVAARGLDIPNVSQVVNYDLPNSVDEYVHRIGRTGRCGNIGRAISFYSSDTDSGLAKDLTKILSDAQQNVPAWLEEEAKASSMSNGGYHNGGRFGGRDTRRGDRGNYSELTNNNSGWQPISSGAPPPSQEEEVWE